LSIEHDLGRELGLYTHKAPYFDPIPKQFAIQRLPLLSQFFTMAAPTEVIRSNERLQFVSQTLGMIYGSLLPFGGTESFRRLITPCVDRKVRQMSQVEVQVNEFLSRRFAPDVVMYLKTESVRSGKVTKRLMKGIPGATDTTSVSLQKISTLVDIPNAEFFDFITINPESVAWTQ
jgi:hypothetical protein